MLRLRCNLETLRIRFFYLTVTIALISCTTGQKSPSLLGHSDTLKCNPLTTSHSSLSIKSLTPIDQDFFVHSLNRDGSPKYTVSKLTSEGTLKTIKTILLDDGPVIVSKSYVKDRLAIFQHGRISIRTTGNVEVRSIDTRGILEENDLEMVFDSKQLWVVFRENESQKYRLFYLKSKASKFASTAYRFEQAPVLIRVNHQVRYAVGIEDNRLVVVQLDTMKKVFLDSGNAPIESFAATEENGTIFAAMVTGDSLLGESKVFVQTVNEENFQVQTKISKDYLEVQLGTPFFVSSNSKIYLGSLNWFEDRSNLTVQAVESKEFGNPIPIGSFKGNHAVDQTISIDQQPFVLLKNRNKFGNMSLKICSVKI